MGTSKSPKTPAGGAWTSPKRQLTEQINGGSFDPQRFVRSALGALGGVAMRSGLIASGGASGSGTGGDGRSDSSTGISALSGAVKGLGGFGAQVASGDLDTALVSLGLEDLRGRPAAEIVARVAEHLSRDAQGRQAEVLEAALRDTIFDIAAVEDTGSYEDLEGAIESFLEREGIEGFIEAFLAQYVFTAIWSYFENHVKSKTDGPADEALTSAVESACRSLVSQELKAMRDSQQFEQIDWFGSAGQLFADKIVRQLQVSLTAPE